MGGQKTEDIDGTDQVNSNYYARGMGVLSLVPQIIVPGVNKMNPETELLWP